MTKKVAIEIKTYEKRNAPRWGGVNKCPKCKEKIKVGQIVMILRGATGGRYSRQGFVRYVHRFCIEEVLEASPLNDDEVQQEYLRLKRRLAQKKTIS